MHVENILDEMISNSKAEKGLAWNFHFLELKLRNKGGMNSWRNTFQFYY